MGLYIGRKTSETVIVSRGDSNSAPRYYRSDVPLGVSSAVKDGLCGLFDDVEPKQQPIFMPCSRAILGLCERRGICSSTVMPFDASVRQTESEAIRCKNEMCLAEGGACTCELGGMQSCSRLVDLGSHRTSVAFWCGVYEKSDDEET